MKRHHAHNESGGIRPPRKTVLDQIEKVYELFANQRDGVLKVAITP